MARNSYNSNLSATAVLSDALVTILITSLHFHPANFRGSNGRSQIIQDTVYMRNYSLSTHKTRMHLTCNPKPTELD